MDDDNYRIMKAIGFNAGQFGDLVMGTVAARAHKEAYPDSKLTIGMARKYSAVQNLFEGHEYFDDVHIWQGYDDWPKADDNLHLAINRYDKVYNAMPQHTEPFWYLHRHQTAELCLMHRLTPPNNLQVSLGKPYHSENSNHIALSLFGATRAEEKNVTEKQGKEIAQLISKLGYIPIQLGLKSEPQVCEKRFLGTFEESITRMLCCHTLITVDTAMAWIASGYSHQVIGLYGYEYYPLAKTSKNWQPVNPNAIYLESPKVSDIILDRIEAALKTLKP